MQENLSYVPRQLEAVVRRYLEIFPVVGLTGPRQSGKSTLLLHLLKGEFPYVSFDDYRMVDAYRSDPIAFMEVYRDGAIFDEVQKVPEIFSQIKLLVDRERNRYGRFIVTGSSQFSFLQSVSESLAGRIGLLSLLPFQFSELPDWAQEKALFHGGYPELVARHYRYEREWFGAYLDTYLDKDVRLMHGIGQMRDFRRFVRLLAANVGMLFNASRFANDLGVAVNTVRRWLSILEASYIVFLLPPYPVNRGKRLVKSPKVYFYDTGLVAYLNEFALMPDKESHPLFGAFFENFVVSECLKWQHHMRAETQLYFYRTSHGVEIDLLIVSPGKREVIEIKSSKSFHPRMAKEVTTFLEQGDRGYVVYAGETLPQKEPVEVLNYQSFLKLLSVK